MGWGFFRFFFGRERNVEFFFPLFFSRGFFFVVDKKKIKKKKKKTTDLDVADDFALGRRRERVAALGQDLHHVVCDEFFFRFFFGKFW